MSGISTVNTVDGKQLKASIISFISLFIAFASTLVNAYIVLYPHHPLEFPRIQLAISLLAVSAIALGVAFHYKARPLELLTPSYAPLSAGRVRWIPLVLAISLLFGVGEMSVRASRDPLIVMNAHLQFLALCIAIVLVIFSLGGVRLALPRIKRAEINWFSLICLGAVVVVAYVVRVWELDIAILRNIDESLFYDTALWFHDDINTGLMGGMPFDPVITRVYSYWNYLTLEILGYNFFSARYTNALIGVISVIAAYEAVRIFFNRKTALIAALLLATFPAHVHYSRLTNPLIAELIAGTVTILFIGRALKWNKRIDWVLAGVALALTHYFYEAARLTTVPFIIMFLLWMSLVLPKRLRGYGKGVVLCFITTMLILIPPYYLMITEGNLFAGRLENVENQRNELAALLEGGIEDEEESHQALWYIGSPFLVYTTVRDLVIGFYDGRYGMVLPLFAPFFLLGFCLLIFLWRYPSIYFLGWLLGVSIGNILILTAHIHVRYSYTHVAAVVFMAVGINYVWQLFQDHFRPQSEALRSVPYALAIIIAVGQTAYFFFDHVNEVNTSYWSNVAGADPWDATLRLTELPPNTQAYFFFDDLDTPRMELTVRLYNGYAYPMLLVSAETVDLTSLPTDRSYAFFVMYDDEEAPALLQATFGERLQGVLYNRVKPQIPSEEVFGLYFVAQEGVEFDLYSLAR